MGHARGTVLRAGALLSRGLLSGALLLGALSADDLLGGAITGGKAKELVDRGIPLLREAEEIYKRSYVLEEGTEEEREAAAKRATDLYDRGTALLQEALEIQEDVAVNAQLGNAARKLAKLRAWLFHREMARKAKERSAPGGGSEAPAPAETPARGAPAPTPEVEAPARAPDTGSRDAPPPALPSIRFPAGGPPAAPIDVELPQKPFDPSREARDVAAITARVRDFYDSQRPEKLVYRHRVCRGKGKLGGGILCEECGGTGRAVNLHHFRKIFWTSFTPLLRDATGASGALAAFHERARKDPSLLGPVVKSCKVLNVEYHGAWARARVSLSTSAGTEERAVTLVGIGSTWFLYHAEADAELLR